ncbi:MAG: ATP-binding protein [Gammaproteobacteria bacterium]|jgi:two-component system phosphate regulon sensor histidine kinase PhoR
MILLSLISIATVFILYIVNSPIVVIFFVVFSYFVIYRFLSREDRLINEPSVRVEKEKQKNKAIFFSEYDKSIFNQNTFPMFIVNKNFIIEKSNVAFNSFVGKDSNNIHLSLAMRSNELNEGLNKAFEKNLKLDVNLIIYDQVHRYVQAQLFPIKIEKEKFVLIILTDETIQKVSEKIKSDFISNVTHELKTPLTAIMGFIETIDGPAKNDEKQKSKFLSIIKTEAERMQRLVNDTLALIRVEETEYQIPNEKVDIYRCASSAIDAAKQTADKKNIQIKLSSSYSQNELFIRGNDDQIIEIFENLISNALTYSQESTTINIDFEAGSSEICFTVEDQGCGIPKQDILKVTERFYRSKNAAQFKKSSSGLGLSIVKHIVNRHAGRLVIESEENTGSIFKVFLPVYNEK